MITRTKRKSLGAAVNSNNRSTQLRCERLWQCMNSNAQAPVALCPTPMPRMSCRQLLRTIRSRSFSSRPRLESKHRAPSVEPRGSPDRPCVEMPPPSRMTRVFSCHGAQSLPSIDCDQSIARPVYFSTCENLGPKAYGADGRCGGCKVDAN